MNPQISEPEPDIRLVRDADTSVDAGARLHCMMGHRPNEMGECSSGTFVCGRRRRMLPSALGCRSSRVLRAVCPICAANRPVSGILRHSSVQSGLSPTFRANRRPTAFKSPVDDRLISGSASLQFLRRPRVVSASRLRYSRIEQTVGSLTRPAGALGFKVRRWCRNHIICDDLPAPINRHCSAVASGWLIAYWFGRWCDGRGLFTCSWY